MNWQGDVIAKQSDLQTQAEASSKIQSQLDNYVLGAVKQLKTMYGLFSNPNLFQKGFDSDLFLSIARNIIKNNGQINALYFGNNNGDFYMVKRIDKNNVISDRIVLRDGKKVTERWVHSGNDITVIRKYKPLKVSYDGTGYDPRKREWYKIARADNVIWTDPYIFFTDSLLGITGSRKIIRKNIKGVLGVDVGLAYLTQFLRDLSFSAVGSIIITDTTRNIIALSDKNNRKYEKIFREYFTADGERKVALLKAEDIDSSKEMKLFSKNIFSISSDDLIKKSLSKKDTFQILLSVLFPKYSKGRILRNFLLRGLTTGAISINDVKYIYTHRSLASFPGISWNIYTVTSRGDINSSWKYVTKIIVWLFIGFIFIFIFIMYQSSKVILRPLLGISMLMTELKTLSLKKRFIYPDFFHIKEVQDIGEVYNDVQGSFTSFRKFVPDVVVKQSFEALYGLRPHMKEKKDVTIMFSDIEGFTSISEKVDPEILCKCLEIYFSEMGSKIRVNDGIIDKFIGDAIMVIFGAFDEKNNSAEQALNAALAMQFAANDINKKIKTIHKDVHFNTRIGINTGDIMIGIVGSDERLNFTVIGDSVNLASRLESENKKYNSHIIVSSHARNKTADTFIFRFLENIRVRGKKKSTEIFQLIGRKDTTSATVQKYIKEYEVLQKHISQQNIDKAKKKIVDIEKQFPDVKDELFLLLKKRLYEE